MGYKNKDVKMHVKNGEIVLHDKAFKELLKSEPVQEILRNEGEKIGEITKEYNGIGRAVIIVKTEKNKQ